MLKGALGNLLAECGFEYWDLGMDLEYKRRLGAELVNRDDFLRIVKRSRVRDVCEDEYGEEKQCQTLHT